MKKEKKIIVQLIENVYEPLSVLDIYFNSKVLPKLKFPRGLVGYTSAKEAKELISRGFAVRSNRKTLNKFKQLLIEGLTKK